jgi:hypothetical protein
MIIWLSASDPEVQYVLHDNPVRNIIFMKTVYKWGKKFDLLWKKTICCLLLEKARMPSFLFISLCDDLVQVLSAEEESKHSTIFYDRLCAWYHDIFTSLVFSWPFVAELCSLRETVETGKKWLLTVKTVQIPYSPVVGLWAILSKFIKKTRIVENRDHLVTDPNPSFICPNDN